MLPTVHLCRLLLLLTLPIATGTSEATTYFVRTVGDDRATGTTVEQAFKTLNRAMQVLKHGDAIVVAPGVYRESSLITERFGTSESKLMIIGDETGQKTSTTAGPVIVQSDSPTAPALRLHRVQHAHVEGLTFGPGTAGIVLEQCRDSIVTRCTFDRLASGLTATRCTDLRIEASEIKRCGLGVSLNSVVRCRISHLTTAGCTSAALSFVLCGSGTLRNNLFVANNSNFVADELSAESWTSDHNVLTGSTGAWGQVPVVAVPHEWFAASGQDRHSIHVAPAFRNPSTLDLRIDPAVRWGGGLPGQKVGIRLDPPVPLDRDGKAFRVREGAVSCGAHEYPEPSDEAGWKPLPVDLEGRGPRQSAGLYRENGTLVRQLLQNATGIGPLWWDGRDEDGRPIDGGTMEVRWVTHDVRVVEDGSIGDNGSALGSYNGDNPEHVALLPDGRFLVATTYDEAGIPLRLHAASGAPIHGVHLAEKSFQAITWSDHQFIGIADPLPHARLVLLDESGERVPLTDAFDSIPLLTPAEVAQVAEEQKSLATHRQALRKYESDLRRLQQQRKPTDTLKKPAPPVVRGFRVGGIAARQGIAYVALTGFGRIRRLDLRSGRHLGDWPLPGIEGIAFDETGSLWAIAGQDLTRVDIQNGSVARRFASSLQHPRYLSVAGGRLAVGDRQDDRIACLDAATGRVLATLGSSIEANRWTPVVPDLFSDPRGLALYPDGRLLVADHLGMRCLWTERRQLVFEQVSTFLDICVAHPLQPEFVYSRMGILRVDESTGAWTITHRFPTAYNDFIASQAFVLEGRPFVAFGKEGAIQILWDVSDPENPRLAAELTRERFPAMQQKGIRPLCITPENGLAGANGCQIRVAPFKGWDSQNRPQWDFAATASRGQKSWPDRPGFTLKRGLTCDPKSGDFYSLAVTDRLKQMVPMWGADGTGVGKVDSEGNVRWFVPSSGNHYQSISSVHDGRHFWIMACKSFGGQIDLFNEDGLLLATGNWGWLVNHQVGFVDIISGCQAFRRTDGKPAAYVEDDLIGRFTRVRVDGSESLQRGTKAIAWLPRPPEEEPPSVHLAGPTVDRSILIPRIEPIPVDGTWTPFERTGVAPQILALPIMTWGRYRPEALLESCRAGAFAASFAHDTEHLYVYIVATDDTPRFDSESPDKMWAFDGIELWVEQEQFGLGFTRDGKAQLFKYRFHGPDGKALYTCNYPIPAGNVWGSKLSEVGRHPLGQRLGHGLGRTLDGAGYALMARIPLQEIRLVGGLPNVAGRQGEANLPTTGQPGEMLRIGVTYDGVERWGREQDFKVSWPASLMYSDPNRSHPFIFGR
ncbi:MAG: right-handed parallel beta-helix repeat-containing protein [Verrucomicrobiales bacterium]|nr:right-handed parallel beta-helix repeat-containing protein [Verrucomicrobiales bacterium]